MLKSIRINVLIFLFLVSLSSIAQKTKPLIIQSLIEKSDNFKPNEKDIDSFNIDEYINNKDMYLFDFYITKNKGKDIDLLDEYKEMNCKKDIIIPTTNNKRDNIPYVMLIETYNNLELDNLPNKLVVMIPIHGKAKSIKYDQNIMDPFENEIVNKNIEILNFPKEENTKSASQDLINSSNRLYQNAPNPFINETIIAYDINLDVKKAVVNIISMQGYLIKNIEIQDRGKGNITVSNEKMLLGNYVCTLVLDGQVASTIVMTFVKE